MLCLKLKQQCQTQVVLTELNQYVDYRKHGFRSFVPCLNSVVLLQPKAAAGATQQSDATTAASSTTAAPAPATAPIPAAAPVPAPVPPPPAPDVVACESTPVSAPEEENPAEKPPDAPATVSPSSTDRYQ